MSGTTQVSLVVYNGIVAASKLDAALTELIGTDQYPNALTGLHAELRDALLMIPPTLGVVDAAVAEVNYDGPDSVACAYPGCTNRVRLRYGGGPQFCSKDHRDAALICLVCGGDIGFEFTRPTSDSEGRATFVCENGHTGVSIVGQRRG